MRNLKYVAILALLLVPILALAQSGGNCTPGAATSGLCNAFAAVGVDSVPEFITYLFSLVSSLIGVVSLVMLIYGGAQLVFSQGSQQIVTKGKETIKYAIYGFVLASASFVIVAAVRTFIGARDTTPGTGSGSGVENPLLISDIYSWINIMTRGILSLLGVVAIMYIIIGGFRYIMAGGNEEQIKAGRATVMWAVIGLVSVILSYTIISIIISSLNAA